MSSFHGPGAVALEHDRGLAPLGACVVSVGLEREDVELEKMPPLVGHLSYDPAKRVALCGAPILGVKAVGDFVMCIRCQVEREWAARP